MTIHRRIRPLLVVILATLPACSSGGTEVGRHGGPVTGPSPSQGYDLQLVAEYGAVEVNRPLRVTFTVTNAGPDQALGIVTVKDLFDLDDVHVWMDPAAFPGGRLIAFDPGQLAGGDEASRDAVLRLLEPMRAQIEAYVAPDEPPDRNPSDNSLMVEVDVAAPTCTEGGKHSRNTPGASVRDTPERQIVCTADGNDRITAGDRDVIRSGAGRDTVLCRRSFCVLDLGAGNDIAKCPGACFVDGGPGRDDCPRGRLVLTRNCER
jgi:hypothetical protein